MATVTSDCWERDWNASNGMLSVVCEAAMAQLSETARLYAILQIAQLNGHLDLDELDAGELEVMRQAVLLVTAERRAVVFAEDDGARLRLTRFYLLHEILNHN